ncbi:MAG: hypothetical protein JWO38_2020 [Gemmataceae bacterium]|nr:hypothetical protein [Gemmataceae bacterium]
MYRAYGLLQPGSDFTLDEAVTRLRPRFAGGTVTRSGDQVTVTLGEWEIELRLNADPSVLAESDMLAEKIAGLEDGTDLESCNRRVEVWSETPDPVIEHLTDFHAVIEVLRTFSGVILVDPTEPALM